jgi:hypothetical protein
LNGQVIYTDEFGATRVLTDPHAIAQLGELNGDLDANVEKKTFIQELKPWSDVTPNGFKVWLTAYLKIAKSATSPAVIYALLVSSISLGVSIGITLVYSSVLEEGYHWSPRDVGLFNVGSWLPKQIIIESLANSGQGGVMPACMMAMFYSGFCADKINVWLARRNGGVHKPEHHLLHLIVPFLTGVIGIVAIAVCSQYPNKLSAWGLVLGWASK